MRFRITHPFHPLRGREFEGIAFFTAFREGRVSYHDDKGRLVSMPIGWTDRSGVDPFVVVANGRALFRPADLLELSRMLKDLRRSATSAAGSVKVIASRP
jgi:hypothetical protein